MELPFYERYPEKYLETQEGIKNFSTYVYLEELHEEFLPETYFPLVGGYRKFPRFKNKRSEDPFVRMYYDEKGIEKSPDWVLPQGSLKRAFKSTGKYAKDMLFMEDEEIELMNEAWTMTEKHFGVYMQDARVMTYEEAKSRVDKSTSSGIPFNSLYSTKKELFENDPDIDAWLEKDWERLAEDENWTSVFSIALKEEVRPSEKDILDKQRTFTAGATDQTIHGSRLFSDMNDKMNSSWLKSSSTVGWSPMNGNWDRLLRKLKTFKNGYALDESEYDSSLRSYMMWGCALLRWKMLREEDRTQANLRRIRTYYRNLVNTVMCTPDGVLVMKLTGNPSGSINTINDNTLILYTLMAYAWLKLHPDVETSLGEFENNTAKCLCGDDNTWTVSDWAHEFYNGRTVIDVWKSIGVITTTDSLDARDPEDLDYLSAHTIFIDGVAVPQYSKDKIITSLLYSNKKKQTPAQALTRACGMMQISYCDKVLYKFLKDIINWLLKRYDNVCAEDPDWITAKCGILSDERLYKLWIGERMYLGPQSFVEKAKKDNKCSIKIVMNNNRQQNRNPKRRGGKGRKGGKATPSMKINMSKPMLLAYQGKPQKRRPRKRTGKRGNNGGGIKGANPRHFKQGMKRKGCFVDEREEILDVTGNGANFAVVNTLALNPGQSASFPTLQKQAVIWQRYRFKYLRYEYQPTVNEFSTAATTGKVILQCNIDAADGPPTTKQGAYATDDELVNSDLPCKRIILNIPPKYLQPLGKDWRFVRQGGLPGGSDIHEYDVGNLFVSTTGTVDNTTKLGELHVYYGVQFENLLNSALESAPTNNQVSWFQTTTVEAAVTGVAQQLLLATASANGVTAVNTAGSIVLPVGNYNIDYNVLATDSAAEQMTLIVVPRKNATTVWVGTNSISEARLSGTTNTILEVNGSIFFSSNGTDAFSLLATATGAAGTLALQGSARITAI